MPLHLAPLSSPLPPGYASGMRTTMTRHPFDRALPWAGRHVLPTSRPAAGRALRFLLAMSVNNTQTCARPLSEHSAAWIRLTHMDSWMSKLISRGYTLQFASPPPRFGSERRLLSHPSHPQTQEIPALLFPRGSFSVQPTAIRLLTGPSHFFQVHGDGTSAVAEKRRQSPVLSGRFAHPGSLSGNGGATHRVSPAAPADTRHWFPHNR